MNSKPSFRIVDNKMHMHVPYALNAPFRTVFKTAKWLGYEKAFQAANTPQNLRKWEAFVEKGADAIEALREYDNAEATTDELQSLADESLRTLRTIEADLEDIERRAELAIATKAQATLQAEELRPSLEQAKCRLATLLQSAQEATDIRDQYLAPVMALYEKHDLDDILKKFSWAASRGYLGKEPLQLARQRIAALVADLSEVGFEVEALNDLAHVSVNRPDKAARFTLMAVQTKLSGVVAV